MSGIVFPDDLDIPVDEVSVPFWDATREPRFVVQHCSQCGLWQHYPRALCRGCGALDPPFETASGTGVVDTFTEVKRAPDSRPVPYVVARIRLTEGPLLLTNLVDAVGRDDLIDKPARIDWAALPDGRHLPVFRIAD